MGSELIIFIPPLFNQYLNLQLKERVIYHIVSKNLEELKSLSNLKPSSTWNGLNYSEYITKMNLVETGGGARG